MAKPIEATPILYGEDALRICEEVANAKFSQEKFDRRKEAIRVYKKLLANGKKARLLRKKAALKK